MRAFWLFFILGFLLGSARTLSSSTKTVKSGPAVEGVQVKSLVSPTPTPLASPTPTPTMKPTLKPTPKPSPSPKPSPMIVLPPDLEELFAKYSGAYSIDKELLKRIAQCESGLNPQAQTQDYSGLFQFSEVLWRQTRTLMAENTDLNLRLNPEEAIKTAAFMVSQNHLGIWPNCNK